MPLVGIIVPTHNAEKTIDRCITSILNQTYKDFELILLNDGSKDASGMICDTYAEKDMRIRVFHKRETLRKKAEQELRKNQNIREAIKA